MAVYYDPDTWTVVADVESINKDKATTKAERRDALDWCLDNKWANKDIGCIERIETATRNGWAMSPYRA